MGGLNVFLDLIHHCVGRLSPINNSHRYNKKTPFSESARQESLACRPVASGSDSRHIPSTLPLFDGHRFGEIARLVYIAPT